MVLNFFELANKGTPQGYLEDFGCHASAFINDLDHRHAREHHQIHIAFSGGKSPIPFLEYMAGFKRWDGYTLSLVDDRIVPPDHEDSNASLIHRHFLDKVRSKFNIEVPFSPLVTDASLPPEMILAKALENYQQPDLALLGMGLDGHTASLFADAPEYEHALSTTDPLVLTTPQNAPHKRISMSLHALQSCKETWLLISGEEKRRVFEEAAKGINPKLPISFILHSKVLCNIFYVP
ncbi:6-phosphogluconolactonase [Helicobacter baculiformis]|uniref:6-phosphogluconolactonase n=1 Tax=Helicobacter baculiformis TaxID=427351 RepID=A0ABV7ZIK0_9HELI|nr:6-phosphogluconolactonase [Helicobacter baculiformis]